MIDCKENGERITHTAWNYAAFMTKQGHRVFPLKRQSKEPLINGWQQRATTDLATVTKWSEEYPDSNYGVLTGDGLFVIDIDVDDQAEVEAEIEKLREDLGFFEIRTIVRTGRGYQLYCATDGVTIRSSTKRLTDKIDIKGEGGYVVGVGSIHPNGRRYEFNDPLTLEKGIVLTKLPKLALKHLASLNGSNPEREGAIEKRRRRENTRDRSPDALDSNELIPEGQRNEILFKFGCQRREVFGINEDDIYAILVEKNKLCDPPLGLQEVRAIAESCARYEAGQPRDTPNQKEGTSHCNTEVQGLFQDNRFIELVRKNVHKFHVGDEAVTELLMVSVASMSVVNTKGTQPKLSGESGMGKTHGVQTVRHLMHPTMCKSASFSAKALFYDDTLHSKMVLFSDDVTISPEVEETVRAAMTDWNSPTEHITLDSKRNPVTLRLPSRIIFWLTSVDNRSTIQLQNRQVEINVDETPDQDKRVEEHQRRLAELGLPDFYTDDEVELLRGAFLYLNQVDFKVKIPFIRNIKFTNVRNRRNLPIFLDFIRAYCVLNHRARVKDEDGALIAEKQDFDNALELFKTVAVQQVTKLNERERQLAVVIKAKSPCDVNAMMDETGLSRNRISELLHGDKDKGNGGMLEKIPELKYYSRFETDEHGNRWGKNHYSLPEDWSIVSSHEAIVSWIDEATDPDDYVDQFRAVSDCFGGKYRNSSEGAEGSDYDLDPDIGGGSNTSTTCFGTSVERGTTKDPNGSISLVTPDRNTETAPHAPTNTSVADSEPAADHQTSVHSVSESPSEVGRNAPETDEVNQDDKLDHLIEDVVTSIEITHRLDHTRRQYLAPDILEAHVANTVQKADGSYDREIIRKRFLELVQHNREIGRRVDWITKGEFPL